MHQTLSIFQTASAMARHAGQRQALTAQNVANSDTPGFRAKTMPSFADAFGESKPFAMQNTRSSHLSQPSNFHLISTTETEPSPNGNAVSVEEELFKAVEISREHNRALTIYRHGMTVLKTALGRS